MRNFRISNLLSSRVRSIEQTSSRMFHISTPILLAFLMSIFATFLVLIDLSYSNVPQRLPNVSLLRPAAVTASWAQREFCSLHSSFALSSLPSTASTVVSSWVSKAKMREKLTTLQYWRYQLYTQKSWAEFVKETDKNAEMLDAWHLQYVQSVLRNKHVNEVRKYSSALCDKHFNGLHKV